ncbi:MAG: gliding motility lipoprotein GldH [Paludibacteraceae bacterium]|nr:gliding motility lipoprotein GldH [Paludibacteraceae bacterium]
MKIQKIIILLSTLSLMACGGRTVYYEYQSVPIDGWAADSVLSFTVPVSDKTATYDVLLHVRHTDAYRYQNMWMFITESPSTIDVKASQTDTIEFYLADDRGHWLGNGHSLKEMPVLYRQQVHFTDSVYRLTIQQGMRDDALRGISDIGLELVKDGKR